jgi:hypothetical protein
MDLATNIRNAIAHCWSSGNQIYVKLSLRAAPARSPYEAARESRIESRNRGPKDTSGS